MTAGATSFLVTSVLTTSVPTTSVPAAWVPVTWWAVDPEPGEPSGPGEQGAVTPEPTTTGSTPDPGPTDGPTPDATTEPSPTAPAEMTPGPTLTATTEPTPEPSATVATTEPVPSPTSTSTGAVPAWPSRPSVVESDVPWAVVVAAGLVLVLTAVGLWWWWRRTVGGAGSASPGSGTSPTRAASAADASAAGSSAADSSAADRPADASPTLVLPAPVPAPDTADPDVLLSGATGDAPDADPLSASADATVRFLVRLGEAMIDAGAPIVQVNATLQRVAAVNGLPDTAVVTLPTALIVSVPQHDTVQTAVSTAGTRVLRLDQVGDVLDLASAASRGDVRPREGLASLLTIVRSQPASTPARRAVGYVAIAAGLALVLGGGWLDILVAAVLGGVVALLLLATRRVPDIYQGLVVSVCAFVVAVPVLLLVRTGLPVGLLAPLAAPLVTFLPGALLTTGVIDLATRQMIAGSSRLAAGAMQLVLLALGITAAAGLVGVPASEVGAAGAGQALGWAGPWVGVLVYAVGVVMNNQAHRGALPWITLVLVVAYAGQVVGGVLLGAVVSSFVGALAMTPVAMLAATRRSAPPFLVTFLPGFWVLVPGALGLVGVTSVLGRSTEHAITTIVTTGVSMVAISLGVLAGLALGGGLQRRLAPDAERIV